MLRGCIGALLFAVLAGCIQQRAVVRPLMPTEVPPVQAHSHWRFTPARVAADSDGYQPPTRLAVLLPMSGPLAAAAVPVRDGLLAGYYGERRRRPELSFYDTRSTADGARQALAQALDAGADQVLGPLAREEVAAVFAAALPVPLLALNRADGPPPHNGASYSLAPEDEGAAAAHYLLARGVRRVVALGNDDDSAARSIAALRDGLQRGGGEIVDTLRIRANQDRAAIARLRAALTGEHAVDAVFIALRGNQARLLAAQWDGTRAGSRPRVATSQLLQGTGTPNEDRVLDGIVFPGEPWLAGRAQPPLAAVSVLADRLPSARGAAGRLFAFGFDAWQLSTHLAQLASRPDLQLSGATGTLRLDAEGMVQRTPVWLTFRRGTVALLDEE